MERLATHTHLGRTGQMAAAPAALLSPGLSHHLPHQQAEGASQLRSNGVHLVDTEATGDFSPDAGTATDESQHAAAAEQGDMQETPSNDDDDHRQEPQMVDRRAAEGILQAAAVLPARSSVLFTDLLNHRCPS